jgi:hypothetical protein
VSVLNKDHDVASGVAGGWVEERIGVEGPNHRPMLMRPDHRLVTRFALA